MNRAPLFVLAAVVAFSAAACPGGGGDGSATRLWLDAREGATPVLSLDHPPVF